MQLVQNTARSDDAEIAAMFDEGSIWPDETAR